MNALRGGGVRGVWRGGITVQHFHHFIVTSLRSSSTQDTREEGQEVSAAGRKKGAFIWEDEGGTAGATGSRRFKTGRGLSNDIFFF